MKHLLIKLFTFLGNSLFLMIVGLVMSAFLFFAYIFWGGLAVTIILFALAAIIIIFYSDSKIKDSIFYLIGIILLALTMFLPITKPFVADILIFYLGTLFYLYPFTIETKRKTSRP